MRRRDWSRALKWTAVATFLALLITPALVPKGFVKRQISAAVSKATGRRLALDGALSISLLPSPRLSAERVTLYDPNGRDGDFLFSAERIAARLNLAALLSGRIEFAEIAVTKPTINLRIDEQGRPNWLLRKPAVEAPPERAQALSMPAPANLVPPSVEPAHASASGTKAEALRSRLADLAGRIDRVLVVDGRASYRDIALDSVDLWLGPRDQAAAFMVKGNVAWHGLHRPFSLATASIAPVLGSSASPATIMFRIGSSELSYRGSASLSPAALDGTLALHGIRGNGIVGAEGTEESGTLATAHLEASDIGILVDHLGVRRPDGMQSVEGSLSVARSGAGVAAQGRIDFGPLDLAALQRTDDSHRPGDDTWPVRDASPERPKPTKPLPLWPDRPLKLAALRDIVADLTIAGGPILLPDVRIGRTALHLRAKDGHVALDLAPAQIGSGTTEFHADAALVNTGGVAIEIRAEARHLAMDAIPPLRRGPFTGGELELDVDLSTQGTSARELADVLAGDVRLAITGGELHLARLMRSASETRIDCPALVDNGRSVASLRLADGTGPIEVSIDASPLRVAGAGSLDVQQRRIELNVAGAAASCLRHFALAGPWNELRSRADGD